MKSLDDLNVGHFSRTKVFVLMKRVCKTPNKFFWNCASAIVCKTNKSSRTDVAETMKAKGIRQKPYSMARLISPLLLKCFVVSAELFVQLFRRLLIQYFLFFGAFLRLSGFYSAQRPPSFVVLIFFSALHTYFCNWSSVPASNASFEFAERLRIDTRKFVAN